MLATDFSGEEVLNDVPVNFLLIIAFGAGILGLLTISSKKLSVFSIAIAACSMIMFRLTFFQYYDIEGYQDSGMIQFEWGWILSIIAFIIGLLCQCFREDDGG